MDFVSRHPALKRDTVEARRFAEIYQLLGLAWEVLALQSKHKNGWLKLSDGHHYTQPLMHRLGVESTARASFYFYNTQAEVDRFVEVVKEIQKFFGQ